MSGTVHLVGAGPGAADLLTVRAARLLAQADIVFHDELVCAEVLALVHGAKVPVGKRCGRHSTAQRFINKQLAEAARRHRLVVRLKGGDPMLFGRAHEELGYLQRRGIRVEVVPGVTAALGAAASLGVSLTQRGRARSVAFVTPRAAPGEPASDWAKAGATADTVALYMAAREADGIVRALIDAGRSGATPVAVVENASLSDERVAAGTLAELPRIAQGLGGGPAIVFVGEVFGALTRRRETEAEAACAG